VLQLFSPSGEILYIHRKTAAVGTDSLGDVDT
jgi:hypothetical protein